MNTMNTKKYNEFKKTQSKLLSDFTKENMFFAFSNEQFDEWLKKLNTTKENIIQTPFWWFMKKESLKNYNDLVKKLDDDLLIFLNDKENLLQAFVYELRNHEFDVTWNHDNTLNALWLKYDNLTDQQKEILQQAKKYFTD